MAGRIRENTYASTPNGRSRGVFLLRTAVLACLAGAFAVAEAGPVRADPAWMEKPYEYVVVDQDVRGILTEFGRNMGLPVVLSDKVRGRARGEIRAKTAGEFLKKISEAQDLTWYFDGSILHVSSDEEFSTQVVDAGVDSATLAKELDRLGLSDRRFTLRATPNSPLIGVSGPPSYIEVVKQTAERLKPPPRVAGDDPRVRVFRGGAKAEVVDASASQSPKSEAPKAQ